MADYYPLLAKAVAVLPDSTPETRAAIYERARNALLGQLRKLDPPVPEADVERESRALEEAVARLESEFASFAYPPADEPPPAPDHGGALAAAGSEPDFASPRDPASPEAAPGDLPPPAVIPPEPGERPSLLFKVRRDPKPADAPEPRRPSSPFARPPQQPRWARGGDAVFDPMSSPTSEDREPRSAFVPDNAASPEAGGGENETGFGRGEASQEPPNGRRPKPDAAIPGLEAADGAGGDADAPIERGRIEPQRPLAPQPPREASAPRRGWIVAAVVAVVVALVAVLAYRLKDRPEDLIAKSLAPAVESGSGGKIVERVEVGDGSEAPASAPSTGAPSAGEVSPAFAAPRAALLVRAPAENAEVKTYQGSVVWKTDNVSSGSGAPLGTAVRAEIDIPEQKVQASMTLQKNDDPTLPASHTMKLQFNFPPGGEWGGVQQIKVPQMRREDASNGEALKGIPVQIVDNAFLVGLNRGNAEAANLDLLRSREWIDIPMLLGNGDIAKLTFEKGAAGQRAVNDALATWRTE